MNDLQLGKMYLVKELFWFLYPTKEVATSTPRPPRAVPATMGIEAAAINANVLSEHFQCNVAVVEPNTYVVLLEVDEDERCYKLLDSNGNIGWIRCLAFSNQFKFVKE